MAYQEILKVECVTCLSCFIYTVIYSAVILVVFLPLQLHENVEHDTLSLQSFVWLYRNQTRRYLKRPQYARNLLVC